MRVYNKSFKYCHTFLRSKKSSIKPNDNFLQQLSKWENERYKFSLTEQDVEEVESADSGVDNIEIHDKEDNTEWIFITKATHWT